MATETEIAAGGNAIRAGSLEVGAPPARFTCPECHGVLSEIREGKILRFRCHTGHAFSMPSLLADVAESIDAGLWSVLRTLQEQALLLRAASQRSTDLGDDTEAAQLIGRAEECEQKGQIIRALLEEPASAEGLQIVRSDSAS